MNKEIDIEAINVALIDDFGNRHGLTFDQSVNTIIHEFMIGEFRRTAAQTYIPTDTPQLRPQVWYSKGKA